MALIRCPDCKKKVSSKAESCPNCGRQFWDDDEVQRAAKPVTIMGFFGAAGCVVKWVMIVVVALALAMYFMPRKYLFKPEVPRPAVEAK